MQSNQTSQWKEIGKYIAEKLDAKILSENETSCELQLSDGSFSRIYVDYPQYKDNKG